MRVFLVFFCFFLLCFAFSQNNCKVANRKLKKVEKHISKGDNVKGTDLLMKIELICSDPLFYSSIGDVYFYLKDMQKAHFFISKVII